MHFVILGNYDLNDTMTDCCCIVQLVATNEALEKEIAQLKEGSVTGEEVQSLQDSVRHLQAQNAVLQHSITCKSVVVSSYVSCIKMFRIVCKSVKQVRK